MVHVLPLLSFLFSLISAGVIAAGPSWPAVQMITHCELDLLRDYETRESRSPSPFTTARFLRWSHMMLR